MKHLSSHQQTRHLYRKALVLITIMGTVLCCDSKNFLVCFLPVLIAAVILFTTIHVATKNKKNN